jgi:hypothetical protein
MAARINKPNHTKAKFTMRVIGLAKLRGWKVTHFLEQTADKGWFNLVLVKDGRMILAELKSAKGALSEEQVEWICWMNDVCKNCHPYVRMFVWRPSDWKIIEEVLFA